MLSGVQWFYFHHLKKGDATFELSVTSSAKMKCSLEELARSRFNPPIREVECILFFSQQYHRRPEYSLVLPIQWAMT